MNKNEDKNKYEHLLELPHHQSKKRKHMSMTERAAQFGAFRALTGYEAAISETARLTDEKAELDEYEKAEIDFKLRYIEENFDRCPEISVIYFVFDEKKQGGEYLTHSGVVKDILEFEKKIVFTDGKKIDIEKIVLISGNCFDENYF